MARGRTIEARRQGGLNAYWAGWASVLLVAACGGHSTNDTPEPPAHGGAADSDALGGDGGSSTSPVAPPGSGSGGISLVDPTPTAGSGGASSPLSDGCDCAGDGFGARVRLDEDEELLEFNRPEEARCSASAPAHAELTKGCAGDLLALWLGADAEGAAPRLTVLGSAVTYVDAEGVTWSGSLTDYPMPEPDAASVIVGQLELIVWSEAGEQRSLHVSYKLCAGSLPRALVIC
jgi:hypothetical protein